MSDLRARPFDQVARHLFGIQGHPAVRIVGIGGNKEPAVDFELLCIRQDEDLRPRHSCEVGAILETLAGPVLPKASRAT